MKQIEGVMDGMSLSLLLPGVVYELTVSLGTWLVCQGVAEEEISLVVPVILPEEHAPAALTSGITVSHVKGRKDGSKS